MIIYYISYYVQYICVYIYKTYISTPQLSLLVFGSHVENQILDKNFKIERSLRIWLLVTFFILK